MRESRKHHGLRECELFEAPAFEENRYEQALGRQDLICDRSLCQEMPMGMTFPLKRMQVTTCNQH